MGETFSTENLHGFSYDLEEVLEPTCQQHIALWTDAIERCLLQEFPGGIPSDPKYTSILDDDSRSTSAGSDDDSRSTSAGSSNPGAERSFDGYHPSRLSSVAGSAISPIEPSPNACTQGGLSTADALKSEDKLRILERRLEASRIAHKLPTNPRSVEARLREFNQPTWGGSGACWARLKKCEANAALKLPSVVEVLTGRASTTSNRRASTCRHRRMSLGTVVMAHESNEQLEADMQKFRMAECDGACGIYQLSACPLEIL